MTTDRAEFNVLTTAYLRWFEELSDRGIFTTDRALVIRAWNPWLEAQTGIPAAEAIGRPLFELCPTLVPRGLDQHYHEALEGEIRILSERFHKYLIPIGRNLQSIGVTEMAQSARIAPLRTGDAIVGTITVIEDVTERVVAEREMRSQIERAEQARRAAEEASKLKDEFLATLSHEIRTPLNAVLGWARILRTQPKLKSRAKALEVIERNANAQLRLVEDLLDMARVISGKLRLQVKAVDLSEVTRLALDVVQPSAQAKQIQITTTFDPDLPSVSGDVDRLQQAIWNLLSNAVKFTSPGGCIEVRVAAVGSHVELSIRDNGQGITRDFLPYVFDRFRQADASASRRHGGLGLGLALVRQIVELHGGTVGVESAGVNRGSRFAVRLPATAVTAHPIRHKAPSASISLAGVTVLVVDDNQDGREMMDAALTQYGARVVTAASSREALEMLSHGAAPPDIVLSDLGMPETDGYELIRQIRSWGAIDVSRVPAIAVTAYANPEDRMRALVAGYQAHLPKPADPLVVATMVANLVDARRSIKSTQS